MHAEASRRFPFFFLLAVQKSVAHFEGGGVVVRKSYTMDSLLLSKNWN